MTLTEVGVDVGVLVGVLVGVYVGVWIKGRGKIEVRQWLKVPKLVVLQMMHVSLTEVGVDVGVLVGVLVGVDVGVLVGVDVGVWRQQREPQLLISEWEYIDNVTSRSRDDA